MIIHQQKKKEEDSVNPEQLTYGLLGKMLNKPYNPINSQNYKQKYYEDLQRQIDEKHYKNEK